MEIEEARIEEIRDYRVFKIKRNVGEEENKSIWNAFNLVPCCDTKGNIIDGRHFGAIICEYAVKMNGGDFDIYYSEKPMSRVWYEISLSMGVDFRTK